MRKRENEGVGQRARDARRGAPGVPDLANHRQARRGQDTANHGDPIKTNSRPTTDEGRATSIRRISALARLRLDNRKGSDYAKIMLRGKSDIITVRFKSTDMPMIRKAARKEGRSVSAYVRDCTMGDFRTTCRDSKIGEEGAIERINTYLEWMVTKKEMGAGRPPVPPTHGATGTPPHKPKWVVK